MTVSVAGLEFIKTREAKKLKAYKDQAGVWSIGYGSLIMPNGRPVKKGDRITDEDAEVLLDSELTRMGFKLELIVKTELDKCQRDAIISFVYNIGIQAFRTSTLLRMLNSGDWTESRLRYQFSRWNKIHIDGKLVVSVGLTKRREMEADLFFSC